MPSDNRIGSDKTLEGVLDSRYVLTPMGCEVTGGHAFDVYGTCRTCGHTERN
jgi:hypothetical protein